MRETGTVPTTGVGRDDYTSEVSLGQVRPGISLKYNQQLATFALCLTDQVPMPYPWIPWVKGPLASGAMSHVYNLNTGIASPYGLSAGYALSIIEIRSGFNQDVDGWLYLDGLLISNPLQAASGHESYTASIGQYSTLLIDPTASFPHFIDVQIINRGLGNMLGGVTYTCILEAIGTPPFPTEKDTRCPLCNNINRVAVTETKIVCSKCGNTYYVFDTTSIKHM